MNRGYSLPPLRLILNNDCNGRCAFCHKEGATYYGQMPLTLIYDCIDSAEKLSISKISLTGGEPTLRQDLNDIINYIQSKPNMHVSLTTNGYKLEGISNSIREPIANLNLSMNSLKWELAQKYQNVSPTLAINALVSFPAQKKTINWVITTENYTEINDFINLCISTNISLDIMFEYSKDTKYLFIQKEILNALIHRYKGDIVLTSTPTLIFNLNDKCHVRVKHPSLSNLLHNNICNECSKYDTCFEKVCAIRIHPNGIVTPCLFQEIIFEGNTMYDKIQNAYNSLQNMTFNNHFFTTS